MTSLEQDMHDGSDLGVRARVATVSVILCTYNRCNSLAEALRSAAAVMLPPPIAWEFLVVDNNSSDRTREVVEEFCKRYPGRFRYLRESQPGKSYALNAGIRESRGDILAFMDDDVTVEPTWLQNLTGPLHDAQYAGVGGRVLPAFTGALPRWLSSDSQQALAPLAMFDLGVDRRLLDQPPYGTNMAFKRSVFERYGTFRTDLGPQPGNEIRNEDTEFGYRLLTAGERIRYEPRAIVHHGVSEKRLTRAYFLAWWFGKGRADIRQFGIKPGANRVCLGIPLYLFRSLTVWTARWLLTIDARRRFSKKLTVWVQAGAIVECFESRRSNR